MKRRLILIRTALAALATAAPLALHAQPIEGPLRIVVGYAPGGSSDRVARIVGEKLQTKLGTPGSLWKTRPELADAWPRSKRHGHDRPARAC
jgi:tripartite-type tricarboxylate transporter receptor subunit TctC